MPEVNPYVGTARAFVGQGLGMSWGDEGEAWLRSKVQDEDYDSALNRIRKEYAQYSDAHPVAQTLAEFGGGALPGLAAMMVPGGQAAGATQLGKAGALTLAKMAGLGAASGAVSGAGSATEGNRGSGAVTGGVVGGVLGGTLPVLGKAGGEALSWLRNRFLPTELTVASRASGKMLQALEDSGLRPSDITSTMDTDRSMRVPSVLANADYGLADLAETVAQRTGGGARKVEKTLTDQRLGAKERVHQQINSRLKPGDYYDDMEQLQKDMRARAGPQYDVAYAVGEVKDPAVLRFLELPQFKKGLAAAQELLAAEDRKLDMSKPTVEVLDQVKRGLDTLIEKETDSLTGKRTDLGRVYIDQKNKFLKELDRVVPEYELARGIYAGGAELQDAMRKGLNEFPKMDHEQVVKMVAKMSKSEKEALRTGVARAMYGQIMDPSGNFNAAQRIIGSPETQAKLQPLFDNPGHFKLFKAALEREAQLFNQSNKILGGAQTGKRMQMRENFEGDDTVGEAIMGSVTGGFATGILSAVRGLIRKGAMNEQTASKMADMLMSKDPHAVAAVVKTLEDYQAALAPKAMRSTKTAAGAITGTTAAIPPDPTDRQPEELKASSAPVDFPETLD